MPKLTDTQLILLSAAAQRADSSLLPAPETLAADASRIASAIAALIKRGLAAAVDVPDAARALRTDDDRHVGAVITDAGRVAIGVEVGVGQPGTGQVATAPVRQTKAALVLAMLLREQGATLAELVEATGWQPHTVRAALTGLRKKGHTLDKRKRDDVTCYHVATAA